MRLVRISKSVLLVTTAALVFGSPLSLNQVPTLHPVPPVPIPVTSGMDVDVDAWTTGVSGYSPEVPFDSVPDDPKNDGYAVLCTCSANKKVKSVLGEAACNHLKSFWPNLKWSGKLNGCKDTANVGLKPLGFEAACQEVSQFENSPFNSTPLHPIALAIRAKCLKYSNHVDN